jgi:predicted nucleotidyltransferase/DNA-binding XRE family transcriptional regulator
VDAASLIREARQSAGLSQAALASRARTSQQTIASYESGLKQPGAGTLERILHACGFELELARLPAASGSPRRLLDEHRATILRLARQNGARNVRVYGSAARDEEDEAGRIDLLVDLQPGRTVLAVAGLAEDLSEALGTRVDVATLELLPARARAKALREALLV